MSQELKWTVILIIVIVATPCGRYSPLQTLSAALLEKTVGQMLYEKQISHMDEVNSSFLLRTFHLSLKYFYIKANS